MCRVLDFNQQQYNTQLIVSRIACLCEVASFVSDQFSFLAQQHQFSKKKTVVLTTLKCFLLVQNTLQEQQIDPSSPGKMKNKSFFIGLLMIARHLQIRKSNMDSSLIFSLVQLPRCHDVIEHTTDSQMTIASITVGGADSFFSLVVCVIFCNILPVLF